MQGCVVLVLRHNDALLEPARVAEAAETSVLLARWGQLHAVRSLVSAVAFVLCSWDWRRGKRGSGQSPRGLAMTSPPIPFEKPNLLDRMFNRVFGALVRRGFGFAHTYLLEVRGRKSGTLYSMPVDLLKHDEKQYLVAPRGYTQWVRNAEVAGTVRLRKGRDVREFRLRALAEAERPPILKAYLDQFRREVQRFFPVPAGSPVEAFGSLAARYPAFELLPEAPPAA